MESGFWLVLALAICCRSGAQTISPPTAPLYATTPVMATTAPGTTPEITTIAPCTTPVGATTEVHTTAEMETTAPTEVHTTAEMETTAPTEVHTTAEMETTAPTEVHTTAEMETTAPTEVHTTAEMETTAPTEVHTTAEMETTAPTEVHTTAEMETTAPTEVHTTAEMETTAPTEVHTTAEMETTAPTEVHTTAEMETTAPTEVHTTAEMETTAPTEVHTTAEMETTAPTEVHTTAEMETTAPTEVHTTAEMETTAPTEVHTTAEMETTAPTEVHTTAEMETTAPTEVHTTAEMETTAPTEVHTTAEMETTAPTEVHTTAEMETTAPTEVHTTAEMETAAPTTTPVEASTAVHTTAPETNPVGATTEIHTTAEMETTAPTTTPTSGTTTFEPSPTPPTLPTTKSPPTLSPTVPPLVCENGGVLENRVCLCPDEWTGDTCSQENFCRKGTLGEFNFPRRAIGRFAYSEEICPEGTSAAGKPRASVRCTTQKGSPGFHDLRELQCGQSLSDIQQNLTSSADLETLASSTQILTSRPEALTAENVTTAAQITNTLLLSPNATERVRVAAIATVSQLLSAEAPDEENESTLILTNTLDQLSLNLSLSSNTSQSQVVQPNLVVQSAQVPAADTRGVQFTSLSGLSGSFAADRIQLNTNTSAPELENGFIVDAMVYVQFPPEVVSSRQTPSNASLGFLLYQNDRFFRSRLYRRQRASIRVLSASVRGQERSVVPQHVELRFRPKMVKGASLYDFACVFWDYDENDWSTSGCWKGNAADGVLQCFCNHTTNFAALWSFRENYKYAEALSVISIIGLSVSILGLMVTIIHHVRENLFRASGRPQRDRKSQVSLLCVCVSLLTFIIIFLSGVQNSSRPSIIQRDNQTNAILLSDQRVEPDVGTCTAVAALLHYFLLATFMWNGVYGTELVMMIRSMRRSLPLYWTTGSLAVGWGVPAVFMAVSLGATYRVEEPLRYRQEEFCWLAALDQNKQFHFGRPMFWGFLLPVGLILVYNVILMVLVSLTTCKKDPQIKSTNTLSLRTKVLVSLSVTVMLGLSWTMGYLVLITSGYTHLVFSILFCISTSTQGLQIFILFTARKKSFREHISRPIQQIQYQLQYTKYSLTRDSSRTTGSTSESYRDLWRPEDGQQS